MDDDALAPPENLAAVILAAGAGRRFGGPKALALCGGRTWLEIAVALNRQAGIDEIVIVIGAQAESVRFRCGPAPETEAGVSWAHNADWEGGRTGSVQCGIRRLSPGCRGFLMHPVDFPLLAAATLRSLRAAFLADGHGARRIFVPVSGGRRGHPVLLGRDVWPEIAALGPDAPLNQVVRRDPGRIIEVTVDDGGIHRNINRVEQLDPGEELGGDR
ncbi:MAG: NTP transferase domain-containing protein [Candidatus Eisenbacteria bacterium]|nr:NTP transferase domain-containing protein [Candidatus Eisenbacteria bacterium]